MKDQTKAPKAIKSEEPEDKILVFKANLTPFVKAKLSLTKGVLFCTPRLRTKTTDQKVVFYMRLHLILVKIYC